MLFNQYSESAHDFCAQLYRGCTDGYMNIWLNDQSSFSITLDDARPPLLTSTLSAIADTNVYFQVTLVPFPFEDGKRGSVKHVTAVPAFFADIDYYHPDKDEKRLPANDDEALKMFGPGGFLPPTILAETGRGRHAYWILEEPITIDGDQMRADMVAVAAAFGSAFRSHALEKFGWKFDSTSDLPRLGRLPGTFNVKGETPLPVKWRTDPNSQRYSIQRIADEIERFGVPIGKPPKETKTTSTGASVQTSDVAAAWDLIRDVEWEKQKLKEGEKPKENFAAVAEGCGWMHGVIESAATTGYDNWLPALGIIGRCHGGERLANAVSAPHPKYTAFETDQKLVEALKATGPVTCAYVEQTLLSPACKTCPFRQSAEPITTPLALGTKGRKSRYVRRLKQYVFSVPEGRFFDLDATEPEIIARGLTKTVAKNAISRMLISLMRRHGPRRR